MKFKANAKNAGGLTGGFISIVTLFCLCFSSYCYAGGEGLAAAATLLLFVLIAANIAFVLLAWIFFVPAAWWRMQKRKINGGWRTAFIKSLWPGSVYVALHGFSMAAFAVYLIFSTRDNSSAWVLELIIFSILSLMFWTWQFTRRIKA